jgi:hypothetical protein
MEGAVLQKRWFGSFKVKRIAHNVPAVYDVLRLRIRALRNKDQQPQNVAEKKTTKGASPTGFFRSPSRRKAAKHIQTC